MKPVIRLLSASLLLSAVPPVLAQDIATIDSEKASHCLLISEESCSDTSEEGCIRKHKEHARELRADSLLITEVSESRYRKPSLAGGIKSVTKVSVAAEYYDCITQNAPDVASPVTRQPSDNTKGKTIAERLKVLKTLREDALISDQEYADKKEEILKEL